MNFMDHVEARPVAELIALWPDTWQRFDSVVGGVAMVAERPEESALKSLVHAPVQEMLKYLLELSRADITEEAFDDIIKIMLTVMQDERITPEQGELVSIVAFSLELFNTLQGQFPEKCAPHLETILNKIVILVNGLAKIPTFGKKTQQPGDSQKQQVPSKKPHVHARGETCTGHSDDESEDDEELNDDDSRLFVWNQCSSVIMSILEEDTARPLIAKISSSLIAPVIQFLTDSDYPQLKMEAAEVLEQLCILSFSPGQIKIWEEMGNEPNVLDEFLNEDEEGEDPSDMFGITQKNTDYYQSFPYCKSELKPEQIEHLLLYLINLNMEGGIMMAEVDVGPIVGVLCGLTANFDNEVSSKIITSIITEAKRLLATSTETVEKLTVLKTMKEIFALSPSFIIEACFADIAGLFEGILAAEQRKLKPVGQGKKNQRGGRGRGGQGRGRGGGGGPAKPDPEKEMHFKVLQKQMASTLERLYLQAGTNIFNVSERFFNSTSTSFKSHDLHFTFLCALGIELAKADGRDDLEAQKRLLASKLETSYRAMSDNLGSKFVSVKSKLEGCKCLSKISTCLDPNGKPVFPDYLTRTLNALLDVATKDALKVGVPVFVYIDRVILANKNSDIVKAKLSDYITIVTKYLSIPESKEEDPLYGLMQMMACEVLEILFFQKEFRDTLKPLVSHLATPMKNVLKETTEAIRHFEEEESDDNNKESASDKLFNAFNFGALSLNDKPASANSDGKVEDVTDATAQPATEATTAPTTQGATTAQTATSAESSAGTGGASSATAPTQPAFKFDFGAPAPNANAAFPKFDFGASNTSPFVAPTFNFGSVGGGTTPSATGTSLGGTSLGGGGATVTSPTFNFAPSTTGGAASPAKTEKSTAQSGRGGHGGARGGGSQAPSGRGRGRGRGRVQEVESDEESDEDSEEDEEIDSDDLDSDEDDEHDEDSDDMPREGQLALALLDIVQEMALVDPENIQFKELLEQALESARYLRTLPEFASEVAPFLREMDKK